MEREPRPTATRPDCTSSRMPNGSSTLMRAASLSAVPVASMVTASVATSTTFARNSWTVSSTWDRVVRSALTFTSSSSRCTLAAGSSSTIFSTLTSLLSCLVTCSSGRPSTSTTMVIRLTDGDSVGPTASEEMLKPRRLNSDATRASTPGLSSTSTESVWVVAISDHLVAVVVGPGVPGGQDLVVARAGRDHRPHHRVLADDEVHDDGHVVDCHRLLDRRVHVVLAVAAQPDAAHRVGELDEVRDALGLQVGVAVATLVEDRLPLPHHAEVA